MCEHVFNSTLRYFKCRLLSTELCRYSVINSSSRTTQLHTNIMVYKGGGYKVNEDGGVMVYINDHRLYCILASLYLSIGWNVCVTFLSSFCLVE